MAARNVPLSLALSFATFIVPLESAEPSVAGTWRGESICATAATACSNETVVYSIKEVPERADVVMIHASKIVNGAPVTMGEGPWKFDRSSGTLEWRTTRQVWLLKVADDRIEGTLTLADQTVFRKMSLKRQK